MSSATISRGHMVVGAVVALVAVAAVVGIAVAALDSSSEPPDDSVRAGAGNGGDDGEAAGPAGDGTDAGPADGEREPPASTSSTPGAEDADPARPTDGSTGTTAGTDESGDSGAGGRVPASTTGTSPGDRSDGRTDDAGRSSTSGGGAEDGDGGSTPGPDQPPTSSGQQSPGDAVVPRSFSCEVESRNDGQTLRVSWRQQAASARVTRNGQLLSPVRQERGSLVEYVDDNDPPLGVSLRYHVTAGSREADCKGRVDGRLFSGSVYVGTVCGGATGGLGPVITPTDAVFLTEGPIVVEGHGLELDGGVVVCGDLGPDLLTGLEDLILHELTLTRPDVTILVARPAALDRLDELGLEHLRVMVIDTPSAIPSLGALFAGFVGEDPRGALAVIEFEGLRELVADDRLVRQVLEDLVSSELGREAVDDSLQVGDLDPEMFEDLRDRLGLPRD